MPWYSKTLTMQEIIDSKNEEIRRSFSYIYRTKNFRPKNMFLISARKPDKGVELFISPSSVNLMADVISEHSFQISNSPSGSRLTLILGDEEEFKSQFSQHERK